MTGFQNDLQRVALRQSQRLMDDPERRRRTINHVFESLTEIKEGEKKQWH